MQKVRCSNITQLASCPFKILSGLEFVEYQENSPTENARLLLEDKLDLALIPAVEFFNPENNFKNYLLTDFGMGTRQRTDSMVLYSDTAPSDIKRVFVYSCSSSSTVLTKLLLGEKFKAYPEIIKIDDLDLDLPLRTGDAMLSLHELPGSIRKDYLLSCDLGTLWYRHTKKPFLFLVWVCKKDLVCTIEYKEIYKTMFGASKYASKLAEDFSSSYQTTPEAAQEFVGDNRRFYIDAFLKSGLNEFVNKINKADVLVSNW